MNYAWSRLYNGDLVFHYTDIGRIVATISEDNGRFNLATFWSPTVQFITEKHAKTWAEQTVKNHDKSATIAN
jgi:hypothetical protein